MGFKQLRKSDNTPVGTRPYAKEDGTEIAKEDIVKGYETTKNRFVIVTEEELKSMAPASAGVAEIVEFVPGAEVDPMVYETAYWMLPDEGGLKAYALLYDGLKKSGYVGIAKLTMHSREHVIALRAGKHGIAVHTLYYPNESRAEDEYHTDLGGISEQESALAGQLIEALATSFDPLKFKDEYRENVLALIASKQAGQEAPKPAAAQPKPPAVDILAALRASIDRKKAA